MNLCTVCERMVIEHPLIRNVHYCANPRCSRLGLLTVFVLTPKEDKPEEKKDDKDLPKPRGK